MNQDDIRALVITAIQSVAPEITAEDIEPDEDLRDTCDLDSMDYLNLLSALKKSCGVNIPETDYPKVRTFTGMVDYLNKHLT
ncbi:acyl carrier protein [Photobacterium sp. CCB-ST2H9]|uniref:acyl carrier protein n=1 Tax=unclassified Photobacterium TaxID=2628852 RepID=UPI002006A6B1|nr:acyl carrier protein [Photobacterium sp. CCB-ST2H9]UTM58707.1 acyl carrier protein [Photobacterium sp. CCB-ST2H9]